MKGRMIKEKEEETEKKYIKSKNMIRVMIRTFVFGR